LIELFRQGGDTLKITLEENEKLSPSKVFNILNFVYTPIFTGNNWVFIDTTSFSPNTNITELNLTAGDVAGFPIHGDCLIADISSVDDKFFHVDEKALEKLSEYANASTEYYTKAQKALKEAYMVTLVTHKIHIKYSTNDIATLEYNYKNDEEAYEFSLMAMTSIIDFEHNIFLKEFIVYIDDHVQEYTITNTEKRIQFLRNMYEWALINEKEFSLIENLVEIINHYEEEII